jgi:negative regulator of sigma E activity
MNMEAQLKMQAYLDGELGPSEAAEVQRLLEQDAQARQQFEELRAVRSLLRDNEPEYRLPESREFYWSKISQAIAMAEAQSAPGREDPAPAWALLLRRWLAPVSAMAMVFLLALAGLKMLSPNHDYAMMEIENYSEDLMVSTFRHPTEKVVVFWLTPKTYDVAAKPAEEIEADELMYQ